jgi:hypothetical protein
MMGRRGGRIAMSYKITSLFLFVQDLPFAEFKPINSCVRERNNYIRVENEGSYGLLMTSLHIWRIRS